MVLGQPLIEPLEHPLNALLVHGVVRELRPRLGVLLPELAKQDYQREPPCHLLVEGKLRGRPVAA